MAFLIPAFLFVSGLLLLVVVSSAMVVARLARRRERAFVTPAVGLLVGLEAFMLYFGGAPAIRVPAFLGLVGLGIALVALAGDGRGWIAAATSAACLEAAWMLGALPTALTYLVLGGATVVCGVAMVVTARRGTEEAVRRWGVAGTVCLWGLTGMAVLTGSAGLWGCVALSAAAATLAVITAVVTGGRGWAVWSAGLGSALLLAAFASMRE